MSVSLPTGGYTKAHANTTFYVDTQRQNTKNTSHLSDFARRRQEIQQHTKAVAVSQDSSPRPSHPVKQQPSINRSEILTAPQSAVERTLQRPFVTKARAVIAPATVHKRTVGPVSLRDQKHSYNKTSMHLWKFEFDGVESSSPSERYVRNYMRRNSAEQPEVSANKPSSRERYSKKPLHQR